MLIFLSTRGGKVQDAADLSMRGYTAAETGHVMNLTTGTVKAYRKFLYSKLDIGSLRELLNLVMMADEESGTGGGQWFYQITLLSVA